MTTTSAGRPPDSSGNTGYGIRAYRDHDRLRIERNYIHHIGGDGIQLAIDGDDGLVDRSEIACVAPPPSSNERSDDIQIVGGSPNLRITNSYLHHNGWLDEVHDIGRFGAVYPCGRQPSDAGREQPHH